MSPTRASLAGAAAASLALAAGCGALRGPWTVTRLAPVAAGEAYEPEPPPNILWVRIASAELPAKTPGGLAWDEGGEADPFFVLSVDGKEVMRGEPESDTVAPTWPAGPSGNLEIRAESEVLIAVFDADPLAEQPIGNGRFTLADAEETQTGRSVVVDIGNHGKVHVDLERAHPLLGLGFDHEHRGDRILVSAVLRYSAAGRAGLTVGDRIDQVGGKRTADFGPTEARKVLTEEIPATGLELIVLRKGGVRESFVLKREAAYPLFPEYGPVD